MGATQYTGHRRLSCFVAPLLAIHKKLETHVDLRTTEEVFFFRQSRLLGVHQCFDRAIAWHSSWINGLPCITRLLTAPPLVPPHRFSVSTSSLSLVCLARGRIGETNDQQHPAATDNTTWTRRSPIPTCRTIHHLRQKKKRRTTDMRAQVQEIFFKTPHTKQVMMFSATLSPEVRPICRKFCHEKVRCHTNITTTASASSRPSSSSSTETIAAAENKRKSKKRNPRPAAVQAAVPHPLPEHTKFQQIFKRGFSCFLASPERRGRGGGGHGDGAEERRVCKARRRGATRRPSSGWLVCFRRMGDFFV